METLDTRGLPREGEIVENLVQITSHVSKHLDVKEFRDFTAGVACVLRKTNDFTKSIALFRRVLTATPASDVESEIRYKIKLKEDLARTYRSGGFNHKSIQLFEKVLEDETRAFDPHHRDTLGTKCKVASALRDLGKYDEAAGKLIEVLQDFENNQDTHSKSFLTAKHNYKLVLDDQGKTEEALKLFKEVSTEYEKNPDSKPEVVISTKVRIALLLGEQGKFEEASAMMLQNISDATKVFGPFHLDIFTCKRHYADLLSDKGKHEEAVRLLLELLETQETELGSEHPDTLCTKNNLAVSYLNTQEFDKALPMLDVEVRERVFGPEHPNTLTTANNLALVMTKQGKFVDALSLHNKILKIQKHVLGPNHPKTLITMYNIGVVHYEMEEFDKAAEVFQDVFLRQLEVIGENHSKTMKTLQCLTDYREILDERNYLIVNFVTLTFADVEMGRSILEASNWNIEAALVTFFKSNSTDDVADPEKKLISITRLWKLILATRRMTIESKKLRCRWKQSQSVTSSTFQSKTTQKLRKNVQYFDSELKSISGSWPKQLVKKLNNQTGYSDKFRKE